MHFIKSILVTLSSMLFCGALYASGFVAEKADSLYRHMSTTQRLNQLVLVSTSQATLPTVSGDFGGIYFSEPLKTSLGKRNQLIVVQLDERLNPFTEELVNLPGLYTLAALSRADLLNTYLYHLEAASKSRGIDMLILPEVNHPGTTVDLVLQKMKAHDPDFFRDKKSLSFTSARKKKELIRVFEENDFWVIPEADTQTVSSRLEKYSDKNSLHRVSGRQNTAQYPRQTLEPCYVPHRPNTKPTGCGDQQSLHHPPATCGRNIPYPE